ncbi:Outer membrane protein beta-barrel domain-containing protein [Dyadobacter soli]|uniref:Outer membrane protein beta-barrel domain-containing protein n=1 Tax=Dyadobacter soli TaxID=659014 RepID=A0A1G7IQ78_9BACT|nr:outer membrane beta-barrel protein [Dyadobacter soli]SDF14900.1 Outer membrane protein beta-barrel domain-containing protein [Dyadobacter soli]
MSRKYLLTVAFVLTLFHQMAVGQGRSKFGGRYTDPFGVLSVQAGVGVAYYMGDLSDGVNMKHLGLGPSISVGALYRLTEHVSARGELRFYQVSGDQQYSKNFQNNLSFKTFNPDINLGLQADLFAYNRQAPINPYLFGGVGATYLSPKAKLGGTWYSLPELTTEGVKYKRMPLVFTAGIGVSIKTTQRLSLGLELCNNFVNSDYLDDVSTVYPNPDQLPSDIARALSDRAPEIGEPQRQPGWNRGSAKSKDSYLFLQVRGTYLIGNRAQNQERKKTRCPKF